MATTHHNDDGTIVVELGTPAKVNGEPHSRVTLRKMQSRDVRHFEVDGGGNLKLDGVGALMDFAASLSTPSAAVDSLESQEDLQAIIDAAQEQLKKYLGRASGENASA